MIEPLQELSIGGMRAVMPPGRHGRSTVVALALFAVSASAYVASVLLLSMTRAWYGVTALALVNGLCTATLFIIGHDACHGSLTPSERLNQIIGRLAFLPSLHPFAAWQLGHNQIHHGWTNLRGRDYGYPPLTLEEFQRLPRYHQLLHRFYRTMFGVAFYYLITIWWRHMIRPATIERGRLGRRFHIDLLLVAAFLGVELLTIARAWGGGVINAQSIGFALAWSAAAYLVWNWLMGFVTFQHHTHMHVRWFNDPESWTFFQGQIQSTVHVKLPRLIEAAFHNIFEHTAHHVDPRIPLYRLRESQRALETALSEHIIVQMGSLQQFRRTLAVCQLYDFEQHRWLRFDGTAAKECPVGNSPNAMVDLRRTSLRQSDIVSADRFTGDEQPVLVPGVTSAARNLGDPQDILLANTPLPQDSSQIRGVRCIV